MEKLLIEQWFSKSQDYPFKILEYGQLNKTDGPDILDATVSIDSKIYRGAIEFDWNAMSWFHHGHFQHYLYQHVILHIFQTGEILYHGNKPLFSLNLAKRELRAKANSFSFLKRKQLFLAHYKKHFRQDQLFLLFLIRSLGYFQNRDQLMWIAYYFLEGKKAPEVIGNSRAIRPSNRLKERIKQALHLSENTFLFQESKLIILSRYNLATLIKNFYTLFNRNISLGNRIGKERICQFLFNWGFPILYQNLELRGNHSFRLYLNDIYDQLKKEKSVKRLHSDLNFSLSELTCTNESTFQF